MSTAVADSAPETPQPAGWHGAYIEIDEAAGRLCVAGREVTLKPLALRLLGVLAAESPGVVRRDVLLARVWNRRPDIVSRNVLSNAVARLRDVLHDADGSLLQCVPGVGYRLHASVAPLPPRHAPAAASAAPAAGVAHRAASAGALQDAGNAAKVRADQYVAALWLDAMRRCGFGSPGMTLIDALRNGIGRAEAELRDAPLALAHIHQILAGHFLVQRDDAAASHHYRRALDFCSSHQDSEGSGDAGPVPDLALELHFALCRTLTTRVTLSGDAADLVSARSELAQAQAKLRRTPGAAASVRLGAQCAVMMLAFYENDWPRALAAAAGLLREADACPSLETRKRWEYRCHHAVILLRASGEAEAIDAIDQLLSGGAPALDTSDVVHLYARTRQGGIYVAAKRWHAAVRVLEPLQADLAAAGHAAAGMSIQAASWLAEAWLETGRLHDAVALALDTHARVARLKGASAEPALEALCTLTRALCAAGRGDEALALLQEGVGPRLPRLAMPGQQHAVLALSRWIDLLFERGDRAGATALLRRLRRRDLQQAVIRPDDALAFFDRCAQLQGRGQRGSAG